jgi:hypothetical protein
MRLVAHQLKLSIISYPRLCCVSFQFLLGWKDHVSCKFLIFDFMQEISMRETDIIHCSHYRCQSSYVAFWWSKSALASFLWVVGVTRFNATTRFQLFVPSNHFGTYGIVQLGYGYRPSVHVGVTNITGRRASVLKLKSSGSSLDTSYLVFYFVDSATEYGTLHTWSRIGLVQTCTLHLESWIQPNVVSWPASGCRLAYGQQLLTAVFSRCACDQPPSRLWPPLFRPADQTAGACVRTQETAAWSLRFARNAPRWPPPRSRSDRRRERALCTGVGVTARPPPGLPGLHFGGCGCFSGQRSWSRCPVPVILCATMLGLVDTATMDAASLRVATKVTALAQRWSHSHRPARRGAKRRTAACSDQDYTGCMLNHLVNHGWQRTDKMDRSESS